MAGAGIPGEGLFHQADAFVGAAEVEESQAMQMADVVAVGDEFQQPLVNPGGVGEATRLMESHRVVKGGLRVGELHVSLSEALRAEVCQHHPAVRTRARPLWRHPCRSRRSAWRG